jgi:hypothetical protein
VTVINLDQIVRGEFAENAHRKDFLPSEIDAIRRALEPIEKAAARLFYQLLSAHRSLAPREPANLILEAADRFLPGKERQGTRTDRPPGKLPGSAGRARDKIGAVVGLSGTTVQKIAAVTGAAEADPRFIPFVEKMDRTGQVNWCLSSALYCSTG